jgi:hypothetical protein
MNGEPAMSAQKESWPRPHRLWVVDLVNRRIVRHRAPSRANYQQRDDVASGNLPLPTLGGDISLAELF